jgi:cytochrome c peroxidase
MAKTTTAWIAAMALSAGCAGTIETQAPADDTTSAALSAPRAGEALFDHQQFGGNGRTCSTCHGEDTALTISPAVVQARYAADPGDPLFRSIDSDDGVGSSYTRLLDDATILATITLPANVAIDGAPAARSATFARAVPTIANIALDPVIMSDGRAPSLEAQAGGAVGAHLEPGRSPTAAELSAIAGYERSEFSSVALARYAKGGSTPELPAGTTDSEKRGRNFFLETPTGLCNHCHSGPMLNQMSPFNPPGMPPGTRFFTALVSELNEAGNDVKSFVFTRGDGSTVSVSSPDPGRALITGHAGEANFFKIPTLWGVSKTAPYFHDNSARTLEDLMAHYTVMFTIFSDGAIQLSAQDQADIIAYLKLL